MYYYFNNPLSITGEIFRPRDLDLIEACENLLKYASYDKDLKKLAKIKLSTAYYSLLGRYIVYKNEGFKNIDDIVLSLRNNLISSYNILMFSHISFRKKIIITLMVIFKPQFIKKCYMVIKKKGKNRNNMNGV